MQTYSVGKTVVKTMESPAVVIVGSKLIPIVLKTIGVEIEESTAAIVVSVIYGTFVGIRNWIKNRRK
jgi:hypothetical protein